VQLTHGGLENSSPTWSPDGRWLAFTSYREGTSDLYIVNSDTNSSGFGETPLTTDNSTDDTPDWSPDGDWVLFTSLRSGRGELFKVNPHSGEVVQLTHGHGSSIDPAWLP
jgi:TolB protein